MSLHHMSCNNNSLRVTRADFDVTLMELDVTKALFLSSSPKKMLTKAAT